MIENLINWLISFIHEVGYPGLFIASFLENLIPPIPSEVIMPLGGYLAGIGKLDIVMVLFVCAIGSTLGNIPYYIVGRCFSQQAMHRFVAKYGRFFFMTTKMLDEIYAVFKKNDKKIVLFGRFIPGARGFIGIPAGSAKMNIFQFLLYAFIGTFVRSSFLVFLGYITGEKKQELLGLYSQYEYLIWPVVIITACIIIGIYMYRTYLGRKKRKNAS